MQARCQKAGTTKLTCRVGNRSCSEQEKTHQEDGSEELGSLVHDSPPQKRSNQSRSWAKRAGDRALMPGIRAGSGEGGVCMDGSPWILRRSCHQAPQSSNAAESIVPRGSADVDQVLEYRTPDRVAVRSTRKDLPDGRNPSPCLS